MAGLCYNGSMTDTEKQICEILIGIDIDGLDCNLYSIYLLFQKNGWLTTNNHWTGKEIIWLTNIGAELLKEKDDDENIQM